MGNVEKDAVKILHARYIKTPEDLRRLQKARQEAKAEVSVYHTSLKLYKPGK